MSNPSGKSTPPELIDALAAKFAFTAPDQSGRQALFLSRDIESANTLQKLLAIDLFVRSVIKAADPPFVFDHTLEGRRLTKVGDLGRQFCALLNMPRMPELQAYEASERVKLFIEVVSLLNLSPDAFIGVPERVIGRDNVCEGELINTVVRRIRDGANEKKFIKALDERRRECAQASSRILRLGGRLSEDYPGLLVMPMDLLYAKENAGVISLTDSERHVTAFLEVLSKTPFQKHVVGYFWRRDFFSEVGFRILFVCFVDPRRVAVRVVPSTSVDVAWRNASGGNCVRQTTEPFLVSSEYLRFIAQLFQADELLRMRPNGSVKQFEICATPTGTPR